MAKDEWVLGTQDLSQTPETSLFDTVLDTASDIWWAIVDTATDVVDDVSDFFGFEEPTQTAIEESNIVKQEWIDDIQKLDDTSIWDTLGDLKDGVWKLFDIHTSSDIKDTDSYYGLQELQKNLNDELAPLFRKIEQSNDANEIKLLQAQIAEVQSRYSEQEINLTNRAIKWNTFEDKQKVLAKINNSLQGTGEISSEAALQTKYSLESDEFIKKVTRTHSTARWFEETEFMGSIQTLKWDLSANLTNWKVSRIRRLQAMRDAWVSQLDMETTISEYNQMEDLYKEFIESSIKHAYDWVDSELMAKTIVQDLGDVKVSRMIQLENNLTADSEATTWLANLESGNYFTGAIQTLGAVISKGIAGVKEAGEDLVWTTDEKKLKKDFWEINTFDKTWINKWLSWSMYNIDDIVLNTIWVLGWATTWIGATKWVWSALTQFSHVSNAVNRFNKVVNSNKVARFIVNNKIVWLKQTGFNVTTWFIPNAVINTAANDVTSEDRILLDITMDLFLSPIMDSIVQTWIKSFKSGSRLIWGISDDTFIKSISDTFWVTKWEADEIYNMTKIWRANTWTKLDTDKKSLDFTMSILNDLQQSEGWVLHKEWIIAKLTEDISYITKEDRGLYNKIIAKLNTGDTIDLAADTLDTIEVERLFKRIDQLNLKSKDNLITWILDNLWVESKDLAAKRAQISSITDSMYDIAVKLKDDIALLRGGRILGKENANEVLKEIWKFQQMVDALWNKFNKVKNYVELYTASWERKVIDITNIETDWARMKVDGQNMFETTSIANKLKRGEYVWMEPNVSHFLRTGDFNLSDDELKLAIEWINKVTWVTPDIVPKSELAWYEWLIAIYKDNETYRIAVWGKYLKWITWTKDKVKVWTSKIKNKTWFDEVEVELNTWNIRQGQINRSIWNRILLNNKEFVGDQLDDMLAGEALNIRKILAKKWKWILDNRFTLKDTHEASNYVRRKLRTELADTFNERELKQFMKVLDDTLFEQSGLDSLSRFAEWVKEIDKINTFASLLDNLWMHAAYRYHTLKLSTDMIEEISKAWTKKQTRRVMAGLLLWEEPIQAFDFIWIQWLPKQVISRIEKMTWIKVGNKLLKTTSSDIRDFLDWLVSAKADTGKYTKEEITLFRKQSEAKVVDKIFKARDVYVSRIMKNAFEWDAATSNMIRALKEEQLVKKWVMTELDISESNKLINNLEWATSLKEVQSLLDNFVNVKITDDQIKLIENKVDDIIDKQISRTDNIMEENIRIFNETEEVLSVFKPLEELHAVHTSKSQYEWDNLINKSLTRTFNPYNKSQIFDDELSKKISDSLTKEFDLVDENGLGLYQLWEQIREGSLSEEWIAWVKTQIEKLQLQLDSVINPSNKLKWGITWSTPSEIKRILKIRDKKLKSLYNRFKADVNATDIKMVWDDGNLLSKKQILDVIFDRKWKMGSHMDLLSGFQNRLKKTFFDWYKINVDNKTTLKHTQLEDNRTLFRKIAEPDISSAEIQYVPVLIDWWDKLYRFVQWSRSKHIHAHNLYAYIKNNNLKVTSTEGKALKGLLWIDKELTLDLDKVATDYWFSKELYLLTLNIWDKDWIWIWFKISDKLNKLWINKAREQVIVDFSKKFKDSYKFTWVKDLDPKTIGKRVSVLAHEDTSMTPWLDMDIVDIHVSEPKVMETYLNAFRHPDKQLNIFTDQEEETIIKLLDKWKEITSEDKVQLVWMYERKLPSLIKMATSKWDNTLDAKWGFLQTPNSDWASYQHRVQTEIMSMYQSYVHHWDPVKFHYAREWADMSKTLWNEITPEMEKSMMEAFNSKTWKWMIWFKNLDWKNVKYDIESSRLVWIESKKLGKSTIIEETTEKYIYDEAWVRRKVIWYSEANTKYNRTASEEIFIEGMEENGITKQVNAQSNFIGQKLLSDYQIGKLNELFDDLNVKLLSKDKLTVSDMSDFASFTTDLRWKLDLENLWDERIRYVKTKIGELLTEFKKPKDTSLWFRGPMIPRTAYKTADGKYMATVDDAVYVSKEKFGLMTKDSWTLKVWNDYYVMTYRSPVANPENFTMNKIVIDHSMVGKEYVALSPFQSFELKQADFDWDHLNIVYIREWAHIGWISSALSFITDNPSMTSEFKERIMKSIYAWNDYHVNQAKALEFIKEFINWNPDWIIMPSVWIAQVDSSVKGMSIRIAHDADITKIINDEMELYAKWIKSKFEYIGFDLDGNPVVNGKVIKMTDIWSKKGDVVLNKDKALESLLKGKLEAYLPTIQSKAPSEFQLANQLIKANEDAIVGKDGISVLSASTRTDSWIRQLSDEYKFRAITWMDEAKVAQVLGLDKNSDQLREFIEIFNKIDLTDKTYNAKSWSLNQQTIDAAKVWHMPKGWEQDLLHAAFGDNVSPQTVDLLSDFGKWYNKVFDLSSTWLDELDYYLKRSKSKFLKEEWIFAPTEMLKDDTNKWKRLFWNNVLLRDAVRDGIEHIKPNLLKTNLSYKAYLNDIAWLKMDNLDEIISKVLISEDDKWLKNIVFRWETVFSRDTPVAEFSLRNVDWKQIKVKTGLKRYWKFYTDVVNRKKVLKNKTEQELQGLGIQLEVKKIPEKEIDHYYKSKKDWKWYFNTNQDYTKNTWRDWIVAKFPRKREEQEALINIILDKIPDGKIEISWTTYTRENIRDMLYAKRGIKFKDNYIKYVLADRFFNMQDLKLNNQVLDSDVLKKKAYVNSISFIKDQVGKVDIDEWVRTKLQWILNSLDWNIEDITEIRIKDNFTIISTTDNTLKSGKVNIDWVDYNLRVADNKIHLEDMTTKENILDELELVSDISIANEFKSYDATRNIDMVKAIWATQRDVLDKELALDKRIDDMVSTASIVNSKIATKYFKKELLRNETMATWLHVDAYDKLISMEKEFADLDKWIKRKIDNHIYYTAIGRDETKHLEAFKDTLEIEYISRMQSHYNEYLDSFVKEHKIDIPPHYNAYRGSIIEDIAWLKISKTVKMWFLEQGIFNKADFEKLAKERMWVNFTPRKFNDLYGGIFEVNIMEDGWRKLLRPIRNTAYNVIYWSLSWFTWLGWLLMGSSQIPVEFLRIQSLTSHLEWFADNVKVDDLMNKYWILDNVWVETAIRVWPQELNAPIWQKAIYKAMDYLGALIWTRKKEAYLALSRKIAAMWGNPMIITDLVLDSARKRWALADLLYTTWFNNLDQFDWYIKWLSKEARDSYLAKVRLATKEMYTDITGWVTSGSYLYRESYLSRRLVPFNFLMGWGNRISASFIEDGALFMKWMNMFAKWSKKEWFDLMFNKSKFMDKMVKNTIMTIALYWKMYSHDDYTGEFDKRKSITEWVMWMNANFIALWMVLPSKVWLAWLKWDWTMSARVYNMFTQILRDTFRELDLTESLTENLWDWMKGDRDSITDAIIEAALDKWAKWLLYNKILVSEGLYSEFRDREDISSILWIWINSEDEKLYFDLYQNSSDRAVEALIENNKHHIVLLEAIKSLPLVWLLYKDSGFSSYSRYSKTTRDFIKFLSSDEMNDSFLNFDKWLTEIQNGWYVWNLFNSVTSISRGKEFDKNFEVEMKNDMNRLNESLMVDVLLERYWDDYFDIIAGHRDGWVEFIRTAINESQQITNQLLMKLSSDHPASAPYILSQLLNQEMYEYWKALKKARDIFGTEDWFINNEREVLQMELLKKYEPLLRASALTENQFASFIALSKRPELLDLMMQWDYIKDTIADRVAMQIAATQSFWRWEVNPLYLTTRATTITNKLEKHLESWNITEDQFKGKIIDIFNYGLDLVNNGNISTDQKVELKSAMLKSLGKYGYVLREDPALHEWFEQWRVNLMHKLFNHIIDLKPYAQDAKIAVAESTWRISKGSGNFVRWYSKSGWFKPNTGLWKQIPELRNMLNGEWNNFKKAFTPWYSWYRSNTQVRPLARSNDKFLPAIEEFRWYMLEQRSNNLIRPSKKYRKPPVYVKVGRAESIPVTPRFQTKPVFTKTTKWLLRNLPDGPKDF